MSYVVLPKLGEIIKVDESLIGAGVRVDTKTSHTLKVPTNSHEDFFVVPYEVTTVSIFLRFLEDAETGAEAEKIYDTSSYATDPNEVEPYLLRDSDLLNRLSDALPPNKNVSPRQQMARRIDAAIAYMRREEALNAITAATNAGARPSAAYPAGGEEFEHESEAEDLQRVIDQPRSHDPRVAPFTEAEKKDQELRMERLAKFVDAIEIVQTDLTLSDLEPGDITDKTVEKLTELAALLNSAT